jgi:hypothetical protein
MVQVAARLTSPRAPVKADLQAPELLSRVLALRSHAAPEAPRSPDVPPFRPRGWNLEASALIRESKASRVSSVLACIHQCAGRLVVGAGRQCGSWHKIPHVLK